MIKPVYQNISSHVIISIVYIISGLITLNWTYIIYLLYINCDIKGLIARSPKSIIISGIILTIYYILVLPYNMNTWNFKDLHWIYEFIGWILICIFSYSPALILLCRTFNIYFQLKYNIHLSSKWKELITLKSNDFDKLSNFYHNFVTNNYVYYIVFIIHGILLVTFLILWLTNNAFNGNLPIYIPKSVLTVMTLPTMIGYFIFALILPVYNDVYYIRQETKYLAVFRIIINILQNVAGYACATDPQLFLFVMSIVSFPTFVTLSVFGLYYPLYKLKLPTRFWEVNLWIKQYNGLKTLSIESDGSDKSIKSIMTIDGVWNDKESLDAFALYCLKEFSVENMIFLIEINEFKSVLHKMFRDNNIDISNDISKKYFDLQSYIPKSAIVGDINTTDINEYDTKLEAVTKLFIKYYLNDSKFGINISYETRQDICQLFNINMNHYNDISSSKYDIKWFVNKLNESSNIELKDLCFIFDNSFKEIYKLIRDTFQRFKLTKEYQDKTQSITINI